MQHAVLGHVHAKLSSTRRTQRIKDGEMEGIAYPRTFFFKRFGFDLVWFSVCAAFPKRLRLSENGEHIYSCG